MVDNKLLLQLSENLLEILDDDEYYDITIEVGNDPYKNDGTLSHIKLSNILPEIFQTILRYIYGGKISLVEYDTLDIIKILIAANELSLQGLISYLQSYLIENKVDWMEQNFNLKNSIQQCIPFIKFNEFSSKEFLNKVYPYKKIIPKDQRNNLIKYFLDHDYELKKNSVPQLIKKEVKIKSIDSKIITIQHAELISKWIDRLEITDELKNSYEFKLILRGSRDGFTAEKFHEICGNKSHTISIIKVEGSAEILGGYNPIMWESRNYSFGFKYEYSNTKDSFIFSFNNKKDIKNHILSRVKDEKYAINHYRDYGPTFGREDLKIYGTFKLSGRCRRESYEKHIRKSVDDFYIEEYEVFQII
ncbi:carbohydrate-binding module family 13 protein [Rhizophagus clarus]|uniref:Carbohydrate-binding module family 13 protein n=1 Tax=Rhizophagus clarus TaxID=94130 RepID=A0A8H3QT57_9GLOM|nr:carbohydrate-binding module family 13 protein [Rhizophagus clarus]